MTYPVWLQRHRYIKPDRFVAGLVGEFGHRVYYVQAREGSRVSNVVCAPMQLACLGDHIDSVLNQLAQGHPAALIPPSRDLPNDYRPLDVPLEGDFRAGTMAISWQPSNDYLQVELFEYGHFEDASQGEAAVLQVDLTPDQARDFVARARKIVELATPVCPFCEQPLHAGGHVCPSANGYRRPDLG